jgi:hypothetical protein
VAATEGPRERKKREAREAITDLREQAVAAYDLLEKGFTGYGAS